MLLNYKKFWWRESTLYLCVIHTYAHMYMYICAYIYIVGCVYIHTLYMCVRGWNICISLQCKIIAKSSLQLNTQRCLCHWTLVAFHVYSPDLNAISATLARSFPACLPLNLPSDLIVPQNNLTHVAVVSWLQSLSTSPSLFIMRSRNNLFFFHPSKIPLWVSIPSSPFMLQTIDYFSSLCYEKIIFLQKLSAFE